MFKNIKKIVAAGIAYSLLMISLKISQLLRLQANLLMLNFKLLLGQPLIMTAPLLQKELLGKGLEKST